MHSNVKNLTVSLIISFLLVFGASCAAISTGQNKEPPTKSTESTADFPNRFKSDDAKTLPTPDAPTKGLFGEKEPTEQDEAELLAGVWRMSYKGPACMAQAEMVFQNNGGYSGFSQCENGAYSFHTVGTWRILQSGAVRVQYTNYDPKEFQGVKVTIPDGETMYYRFLDRNRLGFAGGIIAYRAQ